MVSHLKTTFRQVMMYPVIFLLLTVPAVSLAEAAESRFDVLQGRLVADGFDATMLSRLYQSGQVDFDVKGVSLFFRHQEGTLNYDQFLSERNIERAQNYLAAHESEFEKVEKSFGVERQVIAAIILVETKLGQYLGDRTVFNTLSTMAALADAPLREYFWSRLPEDRRLSKKEYEEKANRKSDWAYKELKAFLTYAGREKIDPLATAGSYAGAFGICQFLPSSILAYGQDGNEDGRIDLFDHADAIASIARYLKNYGWHPGIQREAAYKAIWNYNRSSYYVNTVLKVAERLKG
jgi:membrane-bound lytic murein transglycosylase B